MITVPVNSDFEEIIISAERYAFGRATYIVGSTADYITDILPYLSDKCLFVMRNDIKSGFELYERIGSRSMMQCDRERWQRFAKGLEEEIKRRLNSDL